MENLTLAAHNSTNLYIVLANSKKVSQIEKETVFEFFKNEIAKVHYLLNKDKDLHEGDLRASAQVMCDDCYKYKYFSGLTLHEIREAFDRGVRKYYGDYYGLHVVTYHDWIKSYRDDPERTNALVNKVQSNIDRRVDIDKAKISQEAFEFSFKKYCDEGVVYDVGNAIYDRLEKEGVISYSNDEKNRIFNHVVSAEKERIQSQINSASAKMNRLMVQSLKTELDGLLLNSNIKSLAKREALRLHYEKIKQERGI